MLEELKKIGIKLFKDIIVESTPLSNDTEIDEASKQTSIQDFHSLTESDLTSYNVTKEEYERAQLIKVHPSFRGNAGFFLVEHSFKEDSSFSTSIILKGNYQDNIRHLKGESKLDWQNWSSLTNLLFDAERKLFKLLDFEIMIISNECYVKECNVISDNTLNYEDIYSDRRDFHIPRPLTESEYSEPKSRIYDEDHIFSSNYLSFLPQHLSTFSSSIFSDLQDILNPIFISCDLKAETPSTALLYGRTYANLTNIEKLFKTIGLNKSLFRLSWAQQLYLKMHTHHLAKLSTSFFPIKHEEIVELLSSIKESINSISIESVKNKSYTDIIAQFMIIYQYITVIFTNKLSKLLKYFPNISLTLNAIYQTRQNSLFYSEEELILPSEIDILAPLCPVKFGLEKNIQKLKIFLKQLSFFKRKKGKIRKTISKIHKLLDLRDDLYLTFASFVKALQPILATIEPDKMKLFFTEHDEVRKQSYGAAMVDLKETLQFRNWRFLRESAAIIPPEVYARDLSDLPKISEEMLSCLLERKDIKAMAYNQLTLEGEIGKDILACYSLPISQLMKHRDKKAFIIEASSPLSYACEFAILSNIALYTGIPFAKIALSGKLSLKPHGIDIER